MRVRVRVRVRVRATNVLVAQRDAHDGEAPVAMPADPPRCVRVRVRVRARVRVRVRVRVSWLRLAGEG